MFLRLSTTKEIYILIHNKNLTYNHILVTFIYVLNYYQKEDLKKYSKSTNLSSKEIWEFIGRSSNKRSV